MEINPLHMDIVMFISHPTHQQLLIEIAIQAVMPILDVLAMLLVTKILITMKDQSDMLMTNTT